MPVSAAQTEGWKNVRIDPRYLVLFRQRKPGGAWSDDQRALVNPTTFKESTQAHYSLRPVLGLSHEVAQYVRTGTRKITMEIWLSYFVLMQKGWQVLDGNMPNQSFKIDNPGPGLLLAWRNWFESLLVPAGLGMAPPQLAMCWPYADLYFVGVLETLNTDYERFDYRGAPIEIKMDLTMIETPGGLMVSDRVAQKGLGYGATQEGAIRVPASVTGKYW